MRVNIYAEEMTDRIEIISKEIEGQTFTGLRFYMELPATLPQGTYLAGDPDKVLGALSEPPEVDNGRSVKGPFHHRPGDDDSAAVTFWGKRDLRESLKLALGMLDAHYAKRGR